MGEMCDQKTHGVLPTRLVMSVQHGDWRSWEADTPPRTDGHSYGDSWSKGFESFPCPEELVMELETLERRKAELDIIAEGVRKWKIDLGNG